jgi:hypothetical protein
MLFHSVKSGEISLAVLFFRGSNLHGVVENAHNAFLMSGEKCFKEILLNKVSIFKGDVAKPYLF